MNGGEVGMGFSHKERERQEVPLEKFLVLKNLQPLLFFVAYTISVLIVRHPKPQCSNSQRELPCEA